MKKLVISLLIFISAFTLSATTVNLNTVKQSNQSLYDSEKILTVMEKYHKKYGNKDYVNLRTMYATILYYANIYDIDLAYSLSFFAVESGFSYECKSHYSAVGVGQVTNVALNDFNAWYNKKIPFSYMNDKTKYDYNIMVSLGYLRMCWDRYKVIRNGDDLMKAYNIGVGNLSNIKKGIVTKYIEVNGKKLSYWQYSADCYARKFYECYYDFLSCKK